LNSSFEPARDIIESNPTLSSTTSPTSSSRKSSSHSRCRARVFPTGRAMGQAQTPTSSAFRRSRSKGSSSNWTSISAR
jgi:hypothetical protein